MINDLFISGRQLLVHENDLNNVCFFQDLEKMISSQEDKINSDINNLRS